MFDTMADPGRVLRERGFTAQEVEVLVQGLSPTFAFEPAPGTTAAGGTRFGGTPDLPPRTAWPRPPAPDDPEPIARRGNEDASTHMRAHMARGLPYTFLAQVELAETVRPGCPACGLPGEGRLLFFYDLAVGPWEPGTRTARVLWDRSPRDVLVRVPVPRDLAEADARERAEMAAAWAAHDPTIVPPAGEGTTYAAPARAMRLAPTLRFDDCKLDRDVVPSLNALYEDTGASAGEQFERFWALYRGLFPIRLVKRSDEGAYRQQLLGSPDPEQGDPCCDAFDVTPLTSPTTHAAFGPVHKHTYDELN